MFNAAAADEMTMKEVESDIREFKHTKSVFREWWNGKKIHKNGNVLWQFSTIVLLYSSWLSTVLFGNNVMTTKWNIVFGPETDEKKEGKKNLVEFLRSQSKTLLPIKFHFHSHPRTVRLSEEKSVNLTWFWYLNYTLHCELAFQTIELWVEKRKLLLCDDEECGRTRQAKKEV